MTPAAFAAAYDVPRGTIAKFEAYAALLIDWQTRMNLVGSSTLDDIWGRHFADSAQLLSLAGGLAGPWLDIGSGAGFPALVLALLGRDDLHLVESTGKKCRFLEAVIEATGIEAAVTVHQARIEALPRFPAAVISARACAALTQLFDWGLRFSTPKTLWILPKGESVETELIAAHTRFRFDAELIPSASDPRGRIVVATNVRAVR